MFGKYSVISGYVLPDVTFAVKELNRDLIFTSDLVFIDDILLAIPNTDSFVSLTGKFRFLCVVSVMKDV